MCNISVKFHSDIMNSKGITGQKPFSNTKKGSNSVKNGRILPINNPIPLIADNNMYAKFEKNSVNKYSSYRSEMVSTDGRTDGRTDGQTPKGIT